MFGMARNWNENYVRNGSPQIPDYVRNGRFGKSVKYGNYKKYGIYNNVTTNGEYVIYSKRKIYRKYRLKIMFGMVRLG